jgi:hypothetical protein
MVVIAATLAIAVAATSKLNRSTPNETSAAVRTLDSAFTAPASAGTTPPTSGFSDLNVQIPNSNGDLASTPKPGTFAILGTALLVIATVLRHRGRV